VKLLPRDDNDEDNDDGGAVEVLTRNDAVGAAGVIVIVDDVELVTRFDSNGCGACALLDDEFPSALVVAAVVVVCLRSPSTGANGTRGSGAAAVAITADDDIVDEDDRADVRAASIICATRFTLRD
jgi:hypothetical protein